ncbi:MAG: SH3 domain-containing protein [Anaerolineae bacterium]
MTNLDRLKTILSTADPADQVTVQIDGQSLRLSASELGSGLGLKPPRKLKRVFVTSAAQPSLRIRSQPRTTAPMVNRLFPGEIVDVVDAPLVEGDGYKWLQLADGRGWIAAQYTASLENNFPPSTWKLPFTAAHRGVHASAGGWSPDDRQIDLVRRNRIEVTLIVAYEAGQAVSAVSRFRDAGVRHFVVRASLHKPPTANPGEFVQQTKAVLGEYAQALSGLPLLICVHNEPNLIAEGYASAWRNGAEFAAWFKAVAAAYRTLFPGAKIGFPALSPGIAIPGIRADELTFQRESISAVADADWVGVHYYWARADGTDINPPADRWRAWFGGKPIVATEVGPTDQNVVTTAAMRLAFQRFSVLGIPVIGFILNGAGGWENAAWDAHNIIC